MKLSPFSTSSFPYLLSGTAFTCSGIFGLISEGHYGYRGVAQGLLIIVGFIQCLVGVCQEIIKLNRRVSALEKRAQPDQKPD